MVKMISYVIFVRQLGYIRVINPFKRLSTVPNGFLSVNMFVKGNKTQISTIIISIYQFKSNTLILIAKINLPYTYSSQINLSIF